MTAPSLRIRGVFLAFVADWFLRSMSFRQYMSLFFLVAYGIYRSVVSDHLYIAEDDS